MADPRFYTNHGPFTLGELAALSDSTLGDGADPQARIEDVAPLAVAQAQHISFIDNRRYLDAFEACAAGACVVAPALADRAPAGMALLLNERPYHAYARVARAFYPPEPTNPGVADRAVVAASATLGTDCVVAPFAVVDDDAVLGARATIGAGAIVGRGVTIGDDTSIGANASVSHCDIGARVDIHPGVRIGTRGFGFDMAPDGHLDVPQLGRVIIGDDVEIGANSTVDRGAGPDTVIGNGCKIDNLVQIGHNVQMGEGCVIVAQAGVAGSAQLADHVVLAAQSGVAGHIIIAAGTQLAARSGAMRSTEPGARLAGNPAIPAREYFRQYALLGQLARRHRGGKE